MTLPSQIKDLADLHAVDAAAQRIEVPGDAGPMIWRRWGPSDGEPVVLFHGGSGAWNHWVRNIAALVAAGRNVWVPDLPGFGESARPPSGGDADALPQPMEAAMRVLLGDRPVDLVGFSFGSMVATFIAAQWPARVRRLVLAGMPALGIKSPHALVLRAWAHLDDDAQRRAAHRENLMRLMLWQEESLDEVAMAIQERNLPLDRMRMRRISRTDIIKATLPRVHCPVSAIMGEHDVLYRQVQAAIAPALSVAPDFRGLRFIEDAGHWVQFEQASAFNEALAAALSVPLENALRR